jgi:O-antigen ligase
MRNSSALTSSGPINRMARLALPLLGALGLCVALDLGLLDLIRLGPPAGKGEVFFLELSVLASAAVVVTATAILAPQLARDSAPFLFIILAWHTGFQVNLDHTGTFVLTVFDMLVPLCLFLGLIGRWYLAEEERRTWFQDHWRLMAVFWGFCLWGLVLAIVRGVDSQPMLANLKSLLFYPLILIIMPWCIRGWKQLYSAAGLMIVLIVERAGDGLRQAITHQILKFQTLFNGHLIYRIDGDMAATNQYATYLLSGGLILLALVAASGLKRWTRLALIAPLALIGLALMLTYSRGAWLGTAVALVALLLMLRPRQAFATVGVFIFIAMIIEVVHPGAGTQMLSRANDYDHSILTREQYQAIGFAVIEHFPLGAGWGAWFARTPTGVQAVSGFPWYHDDYLQLATEIGVAGLLSMVAILVSVVSRGWRAARTATNPTRAALVAGLTAAFIGMLVQAATDQFLWHADIAPHIWIVGGLLLSAAALIRADVRIKEAIAEGVGWANRNAAPVSTAGVDRATF